MLVMVANGRGVTALPRRLVEDYAREFGIFLGYREADAELDYLQAVVRMALTHQDDRSPP